VETAAAAREGVAMGGVKVAVVMAAAATEVVMVGATMVVVVVVMAVVREVLANRQRRTVCGRSLVR